MARTADSTLSAMPSAISRNAPLATARDGLVWNMVRRDQQFRPALATRDVIGQAKGRMMERFDIDAPEAFGMLKLMSQHSNTPIAQVAQRVVAGQVWPCTQ